MQKLEPINRFKDVFPMWADSIVKWTPRKDGSVQVELTNKRFLIFTYTAMHVWRLETVRSYENSKKAE